MPNDTPLTPEQVRDLLRKLAAKQGLDPARAESALDPEKHIPGELMDLLTEVAGHLIEAAPKKS